MQPWLIMIGQLAWPIAALIIMFVLIHEVKGGLISHLVPSDGSVSYGDIRITRVGREIKDGENEIAKTDIILQTPPYVEPSEAATEEELTPYETVMTAYSGLAAAVAALAAEHGGWNDQRYVWDNIETLLRKKVIDGPLFGAIRASQQARNSIRKLGSDAVTAAEARTYAQTAYSAEQALRSRLSSC